MKNMLILIVLAVVLAILPSCGDSSVNTSDTMNKYFVYNIGTKSGKLDLYLSPEFIYINTDSSFSVQQILDISKLDPIIDSVSIFTNGYHNGAIVRTKTLLSSSNMERLVERLKSDNRILYAEPFYGFLDPEITIPNIKRSIYEVSCKGACDLKLKHGDYRKELDSLFKKWNITQYKQYEYDNLIYFFYVDKHSYANALKISNLFYESGICEWSEIDYGSLSIPYSLYRK